VRARAHGICEYCLIHEQDTYLGCQIDHIIGEKHGGRTEIGNLAYCCAIYNRAKGSDIGSIDPTIGEFVRFFNPRTDHWNDHFNIQDDPLESKTSIAAVTARILGFNSIERRLERRALKAIGRIPAPEAAQLTQAE
jgi:hypothetical protein